MTSLSTNVLLGASAALAVKAPVRTAIASIPGGVLTGLPNIATWNDGVLQLAVNDRVLYAPAAPDVKTGIYIVQAGLWFRAPDCDGVGDLVKGTRVFGYNDRVWSLRTGNPIVIGTTPLLFEQDLSIANSTLAVKYYNVSTVADNQQTVQLDSAGETVLRALIGGIDQMNDFAVDGAGLLTFSEPTFSGDKLQVQTITAVV